MIGSMEATVMKYIKASNDAYADLVQAAYLNFILSLGHAGVA